jgi:hypothetical protein
MSDDFEYSFERSWYNLFIISLEYLLFFNNLLDDKENTFFSARRKNYKNYILKPVSTEVLQSRLTCINNIEKYIFNSEHPIKRYEWDALHPKGNNLLENKNLQDIISKESFERRELMFFERIFGNCRNLLYELLEGKGKPLEFNENDANYKFENNINHYFGYFEELNLYIGDLHELLTLDLLKIRNSIVNFKIKN